MQHYIDSTLLMLHVSNSILNNSVNYCNRFVLNRHFWRKRTLNMQHLLTQDAHSFDKVRHFDNIYGHRPFLFGPHSLV